MAIKVKHEGNVTSRVYASAAGGKGKRQAEDAKVLASMQRGGNGGGGGGTSGGARAGGSAPTMSAPTSTAPLGSAGQLISPRNTFAQQKELKEIDNAAAKERQDRSDSAAMDRLIFQRETQTERLKQEKADREALEIRKLELQRQFKREEDARAARYEDLIRRGYSHGDAMSIVDLQEEKSATIANKENRLSDDQIQAGVAEIEGRIAKFKPTYKPQVDPNDPSSAIQQVTLADGKVVNLMRDSSGRWSEFVSQGEKDAQALKVAQARAENQEAIALRRESEKAAREERSFVAKFVADALKNYDPNLGEAAPDVETLRKQAIELYRGAYGGTATPAPKSDGAAPAADGIRPLPADEEEKKNKWGSFAR